LADDLIARLQRNALVSCAVMAVLAVAIARDWRAGLAVVGGGVLIATSFLSIRGGIDDLAARRPAGRALLKIAGRYALLAFLAYVMIARLRLPPFGLIAGASSVVAATAVEAVRLLRKKKAQT
jgi:threonine/homoserine/homoserine lactone efflux protein